MFKQRGAVSRRLERQRRVREADARYMAHPRSQQIDAEIAAAMDAGDLPRLEAAQAAFREWRNEWRSRTRR